MTKELREKAIDIKGKKYVLVSDRVIYFNDTYPNGSIITERITEWEMEVVKATVIPDCDNPNRMFTGYSQAKRWEWYINKTSALENAETSAVWRALAMMGIWVLDSIASADEMRKAGADKEEWKPNFTDTAYKKFEAISSQYWSFEEAMKIIKSKYEIDEIFEAKVRTLYKN